MAGGILAAVIGAWAVVRAGRPRRTDVEPVDALSPLEIARRHDEDARALAAKLMPARELAGHEKRADVGHGPDRD